MQGKGASQRGSSVLTTCQATIQDDTKTQITRVSGGRGHTFTGTAKMCISLALYLNFALPSGAQRQTKTALGSSLNLFFLLLNNMATINKSPFPVSHL